jgi:plastocyanin
MSRRVAAPLACAVAVLLALPAAAGAREETQTFRYGPLRVAPYGVNERSYQYGVPAPKVDGYLTGGSVRLVDAAGRPVPLRRVMLHHVIFSNAGARLGERRNPTCERITLFDGVTQVPGLSEPVTGQAEEQIPSRLPPGYGYPILAGDQWVLSWMLMNHSAKSDSVYIEYTAKVVTGEQLTPVYPVWLDVAGCSLDPIFDVPGGGGRGSTFSRSRAIPAPFSGRIVAAAGHLHGGGKSDVLAQPACGGRELLRSVPTWGGPKSEQYRVRPVVHEPGPANMSLVTSARGIPIRAGEPLELTATYDNALPHTRAMGIMVLYATKEAVGDSCGPLPGDLQVDRVAGPADPPAVRVPLNAKRGGSAREVKRPPGRTTLLGSGATIDVGRFRFAPANAAVRQGAELRWRFWDDELHNVTLATGPVGFSSPNGNDGRSFARRFDKPGTYRLFCSLHPVGMNQTVEVLPKGKRR